MASHNGSFCIKSVQPKKLDICIAVTDDFDFGNALSQVYPLLNIIFEYLPVNDLKSCLAVCPAWEEKAQEVMSKRIAPSWFTCYKLDQRGCRVNTIAHSSNLNYNNAELGIILYNNYRLKLTTYVCLHNNIVELTRKSVPEFLEQELVPQSIDYCMLSVHRVVSCFNSGRSSKDVQYHASIFDGVFIPKIQSMRTVMFHCNPGKKKEIKETVNFYIKPHEEVKCVLLFCKTQLNESLYNLLEYLTSKERPRSVALGGGILRGTKTFQQISFKKKIYALKDTVCITFLKDTTSQLDNFNAYSYVIPESDLSKEEFNIKLTNFRKKIVLRRHSLGFRLCCSAKFQDTELESFQEVFPEIPLLGLDAYGEYGWNSYTNTEDEDTDECLKAKRPRRNIRHPKNFPSAENYFSTVVVFITWD